MISPVFRLFIDGVAAKNELGEQDMRTLRETILPFGVTTREEADMLIALERRLGAVSQDFADYLVAEIVGFSVWGARPTGYIDPDTARWLVDSLSCGTGPTKLAVRIAFEVVCEAQSTDQKLVAFVLKATSPIAHILPEMPKVGLAA